MQRAVDPQLPDYARELGSAGCKSHIIERKGYYMHIRIYIHLFEGYRIVTLSESTVSPFLNDRDSANGHAAKPSYQCAKEREKITYYFYNLSSLYYCYDG